MEQMDQLRKLLEDLDKFWNMTSDPRYRGEHPKCGDIILQLIDIFSEMDEDDLRKLLDSMEKDHLEQVTGALMSLDYDWVMDYEQY